MTRCRVDWRLGALSVLHAVLAAWPAAAASYRFVVLADSLGPTSPRVSVAPSIDDGGSVAFLADANGLRRLLVASAPGANALTDFTEIAANSGLSLVGTFTGGRVAFVEGTTIFAGGGGPPVPIYTGSAVIDVPPPMNALGQVAILESARVVVADEAGQAVIAEFGQVFGDGSRIDNMIRPMPDIDGVGRVAYFASLAALQGPICDDKILLSGTAVPLEIAAGGVLRNDCSFRGLDVGIPIASNDTSSAAFTGNFETPTDSVQAVFRDGTVVWEDRITGFEDFSSVAAVALNDANTVAFMLNRTSGRALYIGNDPIGDRVIGAGDSLCGDVVTGLFFHRFGLNDADELAIAVQLSSNRRLIVRAEPTIGVAGECITTVPEASSSSAAAAAAGP